MLNPSEIIIGYRKALNTWLRQFKVIVDLEKRLYKVEESLIGIFKWGQFKPLPELNYVLVFRSFYAKCEACSLDEHESDTFFQVSLVHHNNRRIITHETKDKAEAFLIAGKLSEGLKLNIKDSASVRGQSSWKKV